MKHLSIKQWRRYRRVRKDAIGRWGFAFSWLDVPVMDGVATLPDGRTVESRAETLRVPWLLMESDTA